MIQNRWSPLSFSSQSVSPLEIEALLEAASWSASSFNEQPWQYIVGHRGDEVYIKIVDSLEEGNAWAKKAGVLMVSVEKCSFKYNEKPNRHYAHDVGAASAHMHLQVTQMGLYINQMADFDEDLIRKSFDVSEAYERMAAIPLGYPGDHESLPEDLKKREEAPRQRKDLKQMLWSPEL